MANRGDMVQITRGLHEGSLATVTRVIPAGFGQRERIEAHYLKNGRTVAVNLAATSVRKLS